MMITLTSGERKENQKRFNAKTLRNEGTEPCLIQNRLENADCGN